MGKYKIEDRDILTDEDIGTNEGQIVSRGENGVIDNSSISILPNNVFKSIFQNGAELTIDPNINRFNIVRTSGGTRLTASLLQNSLSIESYDVATSEITMTSSLGTSLTVTNRRTQEYSNYSYEGIVISNSSGLPIATILKNGLQLYGIKASSDTPATDDNDYVRKIDVESLISSAADRSEVKYDESFLNHGGLASDAWLNIDESIHNYYIVLQSNTVLLNINNIIKDRGMHKFRFYIRQNNANPQDGIIFKYMDEDSQTVNAKVSPLQFTNASTGNYLQIWDISVVPVGFVLANCVGHFDL